MNEFDGWSIPDAGDIAPRSAVREIPSPVFEMPIAAHDLACLLIFVAICALLALAVLPDKS